MTAELSENILSFLCDTHCVFRLVKLVAGLIRVRISAIGGDQPS